MRARTSCLTMLRWRSPARFRRPFHARLAKASAVSGAPLLSICRSSRPGKTYAVGARRLINALSSISRESCIEDCVELKGGTFALGWLPYINTHSTNPAWLKPRDGLPDKPVDIPATPERTYASQ